MNLSNLAAVLAELEPLACVPAPATRLRCDLIETEELPVNPEAIEALITMPLRAHARRRKRRRLTPFRDNYSGDFRPFRIY
jgi:hypothetical protein